jgi:hypothetical protein
VLERSLDVVNKHQDVARYAEEADATERQEKEDGIAHNDGITQRSGIRLHLLNARSTARYAAAHPINKGAAGVKHDIFDRNSGDRRPAPKRLFKVVLKRSNAG